MKHTMLFRRGRGLSALVVALTAMSLSAAQAAPRRVMLPAGSVVPVKLDRDLSSKTARPGDRFTATVRYGRDDAGLPSGTRVDGVVREALRSVDNKPGVLDVDFRRITFPGGDSRTLDGSLISLDARSVKRSSSGRLVASTDKSKDRLKFIGIGAGAGLLIGALTKGNALTSALLGAGAGYLYNELKKEKPGDVTLKSGTEFGIRLDRELAFNTDRPDYYRASASERYERYDPRADARDDLRDDPYYQDRDVRDELDRNTPDTGTDIGMLIDDRNVSFRREAQPFTRGNVVYVPLDVVAREARFTYTYDTARRTIYARNRALRLGLNSRIAVLDGERHRLPASPEMRGSRLYVPIEFVALVTGGSVDWDADSRTVVLTTDRDR